MITKTKLVRFAHNWNDGTMEYWNIGSQCCIALKNIVFPIHEINQSWIEKTSTEDLQSSGFGKTRLLYTSWPIKYFLNFHSSSRKLLPTASMLLIAFQEISQKAIVVAAIPWFQHCSIPCRRHKTSVVKSYMISIHYWNSGTLDRLLQTINTIRVIYSKVRTFLCSLFHYPQIPGG